MKKRLMFATVGALVGGTLAYVFKDEDKREHAERKSNQGSEMPIKEAGEPQISNSENANMVAEGSQFGVQYYNELTEKEREILQKSNS